MKSAKLHTIVTYLVDSMKVQELIHKLLEFDRDYTVIIAEFYTIDEEQALRINHHIVGHMVDDEAAEVIFLIPNRDGKIANETV
jgi:hypothetical protein